MSAQEIIQQAVKWLVVHFGKEIVVLVKEKLQHQWRRMFAARNILILGPKQSGKSSLVQYLSSGHPYEIVDGELRAPAPTALAAVVDEKFSVQQGNWLRLRKDVPGDLDLRDTWCQAIEDIQPHGIIYMIDGRHPDDSMREEVRDIQQFVLRSSDMHVGQLATLHIFVNFADQWASTPQEQRRRVRFVRETLEDTTGSTREWGHLRLGAAATHLSPNAKSWEDTQRAVCHFGADLKA